MISQTAEYALRAIAHIALNPTIPQTSQQVAAATLVPLPYLSKVLQSLGRAGIISAQRGLHGGFTLKKPAEEVTVFEVVQAVDPLRRIKTCPLGITSHGENLCPLHRRLDNAMEQVECSFRETTIAEILNEPTTSHPLCPLPQPTA
jgi:Rrf2 family protein